MKSLLLIICFAFGINEGANTVKMKNILFFIKRSTNSNIVVYESNFDKNGYLVTDNPINISWVMNEKNGEREGLSYLEKKLAYGIKTEQISKDKHKIILIADKSRELILEQRGAFRARITSKINKSNIIKVNNLFIQLNNESTWPKVDYIIMTGTDTISKQTTSRKLFIE